MQNQMFEKEKFIQEIKDNVKNLYRKTLEEASQQGREIIKMALPCLPVGCGDIKEPH